MTSSSLLRASFAATALALAVDTLAQNYSSVAVPVTADRLTAGANPRATAGASSPTRALVGEIEVVVRLTNDSLAASQAAAAGRGQRLSRAEQIAYLQTLRAQQSAVVPQVQGLGGREVARLSKSLNAVIVAIDASKLGDLRKLNGVRSARPARDYTLSLDEVVPYVGGAAVQATGVDGSGVHIAVLDSGIDYTHKAFGGPGTVAAYAAAYGTSPSDPKNTTTDGLFPTSKVIGGYDFVGEAWPNAARAADPDPIDYQTHGTHVADIAAGEKGMAPGAKLFAIKVCSAVSSSCNGVATLLGVEYALDPDGDGDLSDAVDVMNLSLGSPYGQEEDDLSAALANAVSLGVVVVAAAGNEGDRPYITGSPGTVPGAISVAQTSVPSAMIPPPLVVTAPASIAGSYRATNTLDWAPVVGTISGQLARPPVDANGLALACSPLAANSLAGKIAVIDRGDCNISLKIANGALAGAIGVIIVNNAPGDPPSFSNGGDSPLVPTLVVSQAIGAILKTALAQGPVSASFSADQQTSAAGSMVSSSARGPSYSAQSIKPEIGAPGAAVSAVAGSGDGTESFGGTSGASPVVAGAAALVLEAYPALPPFEVKARLVNTGETAVYTTLQTNSPELAPITRIGGGEVRVNRAIATTTVAWEDSGEKAPTLSFGYYALSAGTRTYTKTVVVKNTGAASRTYSVSNDFRYANDQASGAVTLAFSPTSLTVPAGGTRTFDVTATISPSLLPTWTLDGGLNGGDGFRLQGVEFDGYVRITGGGDAIHLPWHVLPHKAAAVRASTRKLALGGANSGTVTLTNAAGATAGAVDVFSLIGTSPRTFTGNLPQPGDSYAFIDLQSVGARLVSFGGQIAGSQFGLDVAITTFDPRAHPNYPAQFLVLFDTDSDGVDDYAAFNQEDGGFGVTGRNVTYVGPIIDGSFNGAGYFYTDADLNSPNVIMTIPLGALGLPDTAGFTNLARQLTISVYAVDDYFTGSISDIIGNMRYTPGIPRYFGSLAGGDSVAIGASKTLNVQKVAGGATASPSQTGVLLLYRDARAKQESEAITVTP